LRNCVPVARGSAPEASYLRCACIRLTRPHRTSGGPAYSLCSLAAWIPQAYGVAGCVHVRGHVTRNYTGCLYCFPPT